MADRKGSGVWMAPAADRSQLWMFYCSADIPTEDKAGMDVLGQCGDSLKCVSMHRVHGTCIHSRRTA